MILTDTQRRTVINALQIAADQYHRDAQMMRREKQDRLARQFDDQEYEARRLADNLDD